MRSVPVLLGWAIVCLCALRAPVLAQGLIWSDEITVDPGVRTFTYSGFKTWLALTPDPSDRTRVVATWAEEPEHGYEANVYLVDASGENDGTVRTRTWRDRVWTLQVTRAWDSGWIALEVAPDEGLRVAHYEKLFAPPDRTVLLDGDSTYDELSARLEPVSDGYWIGWKSKSGDVRMARLSGTLELDGEILTLAHSVDAMDVDFGPHGGVIGWLKLDEHHMYWAPLDDRGGLFQEPHMVPEAPDTPRFGLARCADRILYTWPESFRNVRVGGLDIETGDLIFQRTHYVVNELCDLIAGEDGVLLLTPAEALLLDPEGAAKNPAIALSPEAYDDLRVPVALWVADRYLVGWSDLDVKVGVQEHASASWRYVYNSAGATTIFPDGASGPERALNAVWEPLFMQPWFVGDELHVQTGDWHTNEIYHARVEHDGSVGLLQSIGDSSPCDTWMTVRPGVVAGDRLVTYRKEHYVSRWGDVERDFFRLSVLGGETAGLSHGDPHLGASWSVAVVEDKVWVVSDLRPEDEPRHSLVYGPDRSPVLIEPTPNRERSRILEMSDRPYVLWQVGDTLFGGFVPEIGEETIESTALHTAPGLSLDAAVSGGRGGLVLFRSSDPTDEQRLSALILRATGEAFGSPTMIASTSRVGDSHAAWDGERFIVAWQEPSAVENSYDVKVARVTPNGSVLDQGGQTIATTDWNGQPLVAAAAPHLIAVGYGANRVRTVEDVTPIAASGPFAVSLSTGIEITWTVGAGEARTVTVERARASGSDSQIFTTVFEDHSGRAASFFDASVESGGRYAYLVRLRESSGEELVLGPVEIEWAPSEHRQLVLAVYPSPTAGSLTLQLGPDSAKPDRVEIIDVQGRIRATLPEGALRDLASSGSVSLSETWARFPSGTYWVRASAGLRSSSTRFQLLR